MSESAAALSAASTGTRNPGAAVRRPGRWRFGCRERRDVLGLDVRAACGGRGVGVRPLRVRPSWRLCRFPRSQRRSRHSRLNRSRRYGATTAAGEQRHANDLSRRSSREYGEGRSAQQQPVQADGQAGTHQRWPTSALLGEEKKMTCRVPSPHNTKPRPPSGGSGL